MYKTIAIMIVLFTSVGVVWAQGEYPGPQDTPAATTTPSPDQQKLDVAKRQMADLREENARLQEAQERGNAAGQRGDWREAKRQAQIIKKIWEGMTPDQVQTMIAAHDESYALGGDGRLEKRLRRYGVASQSYVKGKVAVEATERENNDNVIAGSLAGMVIFAMIVVAIAIRRRDAR